VRERSAPELTLRAALTGTLLGAVLSLCNIYSGLKIGWGFNMSITAALLAFGIWRAAQAAGAPAFGKLENNINQTAASAGASISSAGLVSAIPAMTMLTGRTLGFLELASWTFLISMVGVLVGVGMRRQMIEVDRLPFAQGIASAETLDRMYASGEEAIRKVLALLGAGALAAAWKTVVHFAPIRNIALPGAIDAGARVVTPMNLTVAIDPSPLMIAVGSLGSLRTGVSMLAGAVCAWLVLGPLALSNGWIELGEVSATGPWFKELVTWLLWPGVAMMVVGSLVSVAFSWRSIARTFTGGSASESASDEARAPVDDVPRRTYYALALFVIAAVAIGQVVLFDIAWWAAILAVLLTWILAAVCGRVSGETSLTPVGAMGKVTQLVFGLLVPGNPTANLMSANVTGGAAAQSGDLLHDLKTGALLGASPRRQAIAQSCGVVGGALAGSAAYLVLLPDPASQIGTAEWPGPAVMTWRAVAEVFAGGVGAMPPYALEAMVAGGVLGALLTVLEKTLPERARAFVPSPAAFGLGFVVQGWYAVSLFAGALIGWLVRRYAKTWSERFLTPIAAGVIAGESLAGVSIAVYAILSA